MKIKVPKRMGGPFIPFFVMALVYLVALIPPWSTWLERLALVLTLMATSGLWMAMAEDEGEDEGDGVWEDAWEEIKQMRRSNTQK